jgi:Aerotolerance regulator N-terminal/von Willebrand factor type A domain
MGSEFFLNSLLWWQWGILAAIPPAILLLYFLKLKRRPLEVPSTFLWMRAIEDLHVNSIWQRLRQNLLLFLQLLFIALLALALLRPGWQGTRLDGERFILLLDTSASMQATDVTENRLAAAKQDCLNLIDAMESGAVAMIISFSDVARVEQTFTDNKNILRAKVKAIESTNRLSDLEEALRAASGLANPGRSSNTEDKQDLQVAEAMPATLYIFSDGGFREIPNFALGNLEPKYVRAGSETPQNVAITSFSTSRNPDHPQKLQTFARIENFGTEKIECSASLYLNGTLLDAQQVSIPPREKQSAGASGVQFEMDDEDEGVLKLEIDVKDDFSLDNAAYTVLNIQRPARVLVVSPSMSKSMRLALSTDEATKVAQISYETPAFMESKGYQEGSSSGLYDLIMYDRCVPPAPPQANTLFIGRVPNFPDWTAKEQPAREKQGAPSIYNIDNVHPLTQLVDMPNVIIVDALDVTPPKGGMSLIDANIGSLLSITPRQSFEDAVLGFELVTTADDGTDKPTTDWSRRRSFPVFFMNALKYLGGVSLQANLSGVRPGEPYPIRTLVPVDRVRVKPPQGGRELEVLRETQQAITFTQTEDLGVYEVREGTGSQLSQQFAVNLFDARESDLLPAENIEIGHASVEKEVKQGRDAVRKELWKWIVMLGLGIVLLEWYIYNKRVYV